MAYGSFHQNLVLMCKTAIWKKSREGVRGQKLQFFPENP